MFCFSCCSAEEMWLGSGPWLSALTCDYHLPGRFSSHTLNSPPSMHVPVTGQPQSKPQADVKWSRDQPEMNVRSTRKEAKTFVDGGCAAEWILTNRTQRMRRVRMLGSSFLCRFRTSITISGQTSTISPYKDQERTCSPLLHPVTTPLLCSCLIALAVDKTERSLLSDLFSATIAHINEHVQSQCILGRCILLNYLLVLHVILQTIASSQAISRSACWTRRCDDT